MLSSAGCYDAGWMLLSLLLLVSVAVYAAQYATSFSTKNTSSNSTSTSNDSASALTPRHALRAPIRALERSLRRCRSQLSGFAYLVCGPTIIDTAYAKSSRKPFVVSTPSNKHVMISSATFIRELADAPNEVLSLHAAAKELLQPKYTMHGFEWQNQRGVEGTGFVRALRSLLTSNLPILIPRLQKVLVQAFDDEVRASSARGDDAQHLVNVFPSIKKVVARTNCLMFFGEHLSQNDEFVMAALQFPQDVIFAAELLRLSPTLLAPTVAHLATRGHRASKLLVKHLTPVVEARMRLRLAEIDSDTTPSADKPVDCMQWIIDTSPRKNPWPASRMIGEVIALWFGSVHQLAMAASFALDHLCSEPDAAELLRAELRTHLKSASVDSNAVNLDDLPLLNSFLMETTRVSSTDAVSCRRKALQRFAYSDGTVVEPGDWTCMPLTAILHDAEHFARPERFDMHRFLRRGRAEAGDVIDSKPHESLDYSDAWRFTDVTAKWPIWGIGKTACPGRFYASHVLKMLLVHVLQHYEVQMDDSRRRRAATWRSSIVPLASAKIIFTRIGGWRSNKL